MSPLEVMNSIRVLLVLYSPDGEVSMVTDGYGLLDEEVGAGEAVAAGGGVGVLFGEFALSKPV